MTYNIIESEFQRDNTSAYQLSILIGVDSLVYSIYDTSDNKMLALKSCSLNDKGNGTSGKSESLAAALEKEDLLNTPYGRVKIAFQNSKVALIPGRLYNESENASYLDGVSENSGEGEFFVDEMASLKIKLVYEKEKRIIEVLKKHFASARFYNSATPFLNDCLKTIPSASDQAAFLCFGKDSFQLAIFENRELLFYNSFPGVIANDVMYFTLLAYEQYGLDVNKTPLLLSGQLMEESDIYKLLYRYVANLSFSPPPEHIKFGKNSSAINPNFFTHLHSLLLCI